VSGIDSTTWQALGVTLTVVGLLVSVLLWRRRGPAAGLRGVAWSLLPAAAGLTGTLRLLWQVGDEVASWAVRLVFSPLVWAGIVLAGVSVVLFGVSAAMRSRGVGGRPKSRGKERSLPAERSVPAAGPAKPPARGAAKGAAQDDDDMADIEAILRKHGIQ
jgi:hypothetical protein